MPPLYRDLLSVFLAVSLAVTLLHLVNWHFSLFARFIFLPRHQRLQQKVDYSNALTKSMIAYMLFPFFLGIALLAFPLMALPDTSYASSINTLLSVVIMIISFLAFCITALSALYSLFSMLHNPWSLGNKYLRKSIRLSGITRYIYITAGFLIAVSLILTAFKDDGIRWFLNHTTGLTGSDFALPDLLQLLPSLSLTVLIIGVFILLVTELQAQKGPPAKCPVCDNDMHRGIWGKLVCRNCSLQMHSRKE